MTFGNHLYGIGNAVGEIESHVSIYLSSKCSESSSSTDITRKRPLDILLGCIHVHASILTLLDVSALEQIFQTSYSVCVLQKTENGKALKQGLVSKRVFLGACTITNESI